MSFEQWFYTLPLRWRDRFLRKQVDQELNDELHDHLEQQIQINLEKGIRADAQSQAVGPRESYFARPYRSRSRLARLIRSCLEAGAKRLPGSLWTCTRRAFQQTVAQHQSGIIGAVLAASVPKRSLINS